MGQRCRCCSLPDRELLDLALVGGASMRRVAARFRVPATCVRRHRQRHLPAELVEAQRLRELSRANTLAERLLYLEQEAAAVLLEAQGERGASWQSRTAHRRTRLQAVEELRRLVELREVETRLVEIEQAAQEARLRSEVSGGVE